MEENNNSLDCLYAVSFFKLLLTKVARLYVYSIVIVKQNCFFQSDQSGWQKIAGRILHSINSECETQSESPNWSQKKMFKPLSCAISDSYLPDHVPKDSPAYSTKYVQVNKTRYIVAFRRMERGSLHWSFDNDFELKNTVGSRNAVMKCRIVV